MVPQSRACSIELVVEPIELRGQMREVVILKLEDNGTVSPEVHEKPAEVVRET
jgi:hypothetical protein